MTTPKETLYSIFYIVAFALAIFAGLSRGFTDTHTPPLPFIIEFFCLPVGLILFFIDLLKNDTANTFLKLRVHIFGLIANGLIMLYILIRY